MVLLAGGESTVRPDEPPSPCSRALTLVRCTAV
jgi:hypothetical protein